MEPASAFPFIAPMKISDDEARALAFIAALIGLTALGRWVDRPRAVLPDAEVDIASLAMASETTLARAKGGGRAPGVSSTSAARKPVVEPRTVRALPGGAPGGSRGAEPPGAAFATPMDLNRATAEELERLPGVGPALALRIIARRDSAGPFRTLQQLDSVRGVGPALLARLKPLLRLAR
jgi:competence ComEA-like helix-hairpin-helix protein